MSVVSRLAAMGFDVVTRKEWGTVHESLYQSRRRNKPVKLPVRYSFAHISVTKNTSSFAADMRTLERIGYERFGSGISYNWAIDPDTGQIGEGQPVDAKGTHTVNDKGISGFPENLNLYGHAICCIGMPGLKVSERFKLSFAALLQASYSEGVMVTGAPLYPHSMFANKDCPTDAVRRVLPEIRSTAIQMGEIMGLEWWSEVPNAPEDPDGSKLKLGEAVLRGNHAYWHGPVDGSEMAERVRKLEERK